MGKQQQTLIHTYSTRQFGKMKVENTRKTNEEQNHFVCAHTHTFFHFSFAATDSPDRKTAKTPPPPSSSSGSVQKCKAILLVFPYLNWFLGDIMICYFSIDGRRKKTDEVSFYNYGEGKFFFCLIISKCQ